MKYRSRYHSINLLAIFYYENVETYGLDELLKPIVEEIKLLEHGVEFEIDGKTEKIWGTVTALVEDNLIKWAKAFRSSHCSSVGT